MLPQELIDSILSDVDNDSLRACALTSRSFLLPAQALLFREMSFPMQQRLRGQDHGASNPITLLVQGTSDMFSSSPHLLAFVREVKLGSMYGKEGWDALKGLLCTLYPAKIKRLSMEGTLEAMPGDVCVALTGIFAQPSLQSVVLWSWDEIPPSTIWAAFASCQNVVVRCNTLQMVTAIDVSPTSKQGTDTYPSPAIDAGDGAMPLKHLAMLDRQGAGDFLLQPTMSRFIRGLQQLEIFADAIAAVHFCSATLTHLTLHTIWALESAEFPRLGALRVLTLENTTTSAWAIPMEFVAPSLPTSLPRLEVLNVKALVEGSGMAQASDLDAALTALSCLRQVNLTIYCTVTICGGVELIDYRKSVEETLPGVHAAGLLTFSHIGLGSMQAH